MAAVLRLYYWGQYSLVTNPKSKWILVRDYSTY